MQYNQSQLLTALADIKAYVQIATNNVSVQNFKNELLKIDDYISTRKYTDALKLLDFIQEKILQNGSEQEKEKLYASYASIYLQRLPVDKEKLREILSKLVIYTQDEINKIYRKALFFIYEDKMAEALKIIEENVQKAPNLFLDIKAYVFFTQNKYEELFEFLDNSTFANKNVWKVRVLLNTQKIDEAYQLIKNNQKDFEQDFETQFIKNHITCYFLLQQKERLFTKSSLLKECDEALEKINLQIKTVYDDTYIYSELLTDKMMLELLLGKGNISECLKELEKLNSTNPNYLRNKALYDLSIRDFKKAFEEFDSYCKDYPQDNTAKELKAIALYEYAPQKAIEELSKLEDSLENIPQKIKIVYAYFNMYNFEDAVHLINQLSSSISESFYIYNAYGDYYCCVQKSVDAFSQYSKAIGCKDGEINKVDTFGRMMQIANTLQTTNMVDECISKSEFLPKRALLECYSYQLISLYIVKKDFDTALKLIEEYKNFYSVNSKINYLEMLCYHDSGRNEEIIKVFNSDNTGLADEQIQQKLKMLVAAYQKIGNIKKAQEIFYLLSEPKNEQEFIEKIYVAKGINLERESLECALEAYKKYPNTLSVLETFLDVVINRKDHFLDDIPEFEIAYRECLYKYENIPEDERNLKILVMPLKFRSK